MFWKLFLPDYVHFFNDGPLGLQKAAWMRLPAGFHGHWDDLDGLGFSGGASVVNADSLLRWGFGPVGYAKFYIPFALWVLGAGAYFFFRRLGMTTVAAALGGLAACLTTNYFSNAAWGASPAIFAFGMNFLALGALAKRDKLPFWISPALAGLAVGVNVMEAADIGVMFSLVVAAYVVYQAWVESSPRTLSGIMIGVGRTVIIVAAFAGFIALAAISSLHWGQCRRYGRQQEGGCAEAGPMEFCHRVELAKKGNALVDYSRRVRRPRGFR